MILPTRYIDTAMDKVTVLVGYKCGVAPPCNGKSHTLTTELAHRTNSYGLPHVMVYEKVKE